MSATLLLRSAGRKGLLALSGRRTLRAMDGDRLARLRWRRRGAWMWPAFIATVVLDAVIGHLLPPAGETQALLGAALVAVFLNLLAVLVGWPSGLLLRRRRRDLPGLVARDYAGTAAILAVSVVLLIAGLLHRPTVLAHRSSKRDAIVRAQAFIGARAPAEFRRNLTVVDVYAIESGAVYRICVPDAGRVRTYCVVVRDREPFPGGVTFAGYESNTLFSQGAG